MTLVTVDIEGPVATIRLNDSAGRNQLSPRLRAEAIAALDRVAAAPQVRAVVLEGLPDLFCAGGSAEQMLGDREHRVDGVWAFFDAVVRCPVPVVAAARGHAMGGGFLLALYCDVTVLSERSRYAANFVTYGFTPALGATFLLPARLGPALGTELLYSGRSYRGDELAARGAGVRVTAHDRVSAEAQRIALRIAGAPRDVVERLKSQLRAGLAALAADAHEREIADHEATITSSEARRRIRALHADHRAVWP